MMIGEVLYHNLTYLDQTDSSTLYRGFELEEMFVIKLIVSKKQQNLEKNKARYHKEVHCHESI